MKPRIGVLTLGVDDLDRAFRFYREGLGLPTPGIVGQEFEHGSVMFVDMEGGLKLALFPRDDLAHDAGISKSRSHNVSTKDEIDTVMNQVAAAGARIVKSAAPTFWGGYAGYFQVPLAVSGQQQKSFASMVQHEDLRQPGQDSTIP